MKNIDSIIREALSKDDAEIYEMLEEQSMPRQAIEVFRGRHGILIAIQTLVSVFLTIVMVFSAYSAFQTQVPIEVTRWSFLAMFCLIMVYAIKVFFLMEMNKISIVRELKRVELQLAAIKSIADRTT